MWKINTGAGMKLFDGVHAITAQGVLAGVKLVLPEDMEVESPYMRAYPLLLQGVEAALRRPSFREAMLTVWAWIPYVVKFAPIVREFPEHEVATALQNLRLYPGREEISLQHFWMIANLVEDRGVVATTKLLHFSCPQLYPIMDNRMRSAYTSIRLHALTAEEVYAEYIRMAQRLREIAVDVDVPAFRAALQCVDQVELTGIRLLELGLYYIGGMK